MLNRVILMGRLTADPELRKTASDLSVTSFTLAVDRNYGKGADRQTDFINCVAWRQTAEFISRYFSKGRLMAVEGSLQVRNYVDKNENKRQAVEVLVDQAFFADSKNSAPSSSAVDDFGPPPPPSRSYGSSAAPAATSFQQNAPAASFGYSSGSAEDFEEVSEDEEDLPF
ncbi:MAG: single-stranded DNA-binding protein [Negativibacillus massiliensis]|jgi:single-strand DNA-binding protein|uniref:single-stranded DNA-binding protein n=2 Tax=Negativibacillus massiliensis TaxID=1871035 RepID=UPI00033615EF|nr:single-stranded DNA-binding protein [Negativibacillus massiliensis]MBS5138981.1 single-stranded DNA-binding protein [Clostridium sp.]MCI6348317.1 single-stranded DNA-binding protein [Negativibacillus massiliensis]MDY4046698.1 single-stranded DNA-binding protein [Negativibacillus massiliensis]CDA76325.1 single-stranded DNA-binding protein [Clostridium sp. CAG:242]